MCTSAKTFQLLSEPCVKVSMNSFDLPDDVFENGEKKPQKKSTKLKKREAPEVREDHIAFAEMQRARKANSLSQDNAPPPAKKQQTSVAAAG